MTDSNYETEQEDFWSGDFGDHYIERNNSIEMLASQLNFFSRALKSAIGVESCIEFGANIGVNLKAIKMLYPNMDLNAIEINESAQMELSKVVNHSNIYKGSILDYPVSKVFDLVIIKGVLIHINPQMLKKTYEKLVESTCKYLLVAEYYNPSPVSLSYRGYKDRLFKRDFVGEIIDNFPSMKLIDYGFSYRRDPHFPQDDITWFLLEKT